jgi:hypothetical protein
VANLSNGAVKMQLLKLRRIGDKTTREIQNRDLICGWQQQLKIYNPISKRWYYGDRRKLFMQSCSFAGSKDGSIRRGHSSERAFSDVGRHFL